MSVIDFQVIRGKDGDRYGIGAYYAGGRLRDDVDKRRGIRLLGEAQQVRFKTFVLFEPVF
jgi:hypothetical protein